MQVLKNFIRQNFSAFSFFFDQLGYRVFLAMFFSLVVGILDGFGLTMFLPLLQMVNGEKGVQGEELGKLGFLVESIQDSGITLSLTLVLCIMVIFFFLKGIAVYGNAVYRTIIRQFFIRNLREQLLDRFNRIRYKYFLLSNIGRIQNTMSGEVERVSRSFQDYFRTIESGILVGVYMSFAFFVDAKFALLVTLGGALTNILYNAIYKYTKEASTKFTKNSHGYQGEIIQHVAYFKYLKATALLDTYGRHLKKSILAIELMRRKIGMLNAILAAAREPILISIVALVIIIQVKVLNAPLGPILISLLFFYRALTALLGMQSSWNRFLEVSGSLDNVIAFKDELKENCEEVGRLTINQFNQSIQMKEVAVSFGEEKILEDINLEIKKNETIAFVGESGSGKTTLVNLLAGLLPADEGRVFIDGTAAGKINMTSFQSRVGYITQEPVIFNDSIFNNVSFWQPPNTKNVDRFEEAIGKAAIADFIETLPDKADTILGNNGVNLSGGQRQRISIARELYKDVDILIMDEATSALDSETEKSIQESIDQIKGQFTIILVAHRLSTIKNADRVVLMKNGHIEMVGTYDELIERSDAFKRMIQLQEL